MNIRAVTVERGIATLTHQSHLSTLLFIGNSRSRNPENTSVREIGTSSQSVDMEAAQAELEGGYYDDEDSDAWSEERDEDRDEEIQQQDRSIIHNTSPDIVGGSDLQI